LPGRLDMLSRAGHMILAHHGGDDRLALELALART
jgi:hypothetical protein